MALPFSPRPFCPLEKVRGIDRLVSQISSLFRNCHAASAELFEASRLQETRIAYQQLRWACQFVVEAHSAFPFVICPSWHSR